MPGRDKPIVAITMAEASGIGPEILMKGMNERSIFDHCRPLLIGDYKIMKMVRDELGIPAKVRAIKTVEDAVWEGDTANLIDLDNIPLGSFTKRQPNAVTGKAMIEYSEAAIRLCMQKKAQGAVGGPHSKKAADDAGIPFTGYPGLISRISASAVAIGVPINWATVDHGCALDISWKGVADPAALIETIRLVSSREVRS